MAADPQPLGVPFHWKLIFDDEFEKDPSLNTNLWTPYWNTDGSTQNGTVMDSSNVSVSGGTLNLTLTASRTGAFVSTEGHFEFRYGYAEARIYLPRASDDLIANWPAWWAVGQSWPIDGELDIMEGLGGFACHYFHSDATRPGGCAPGIYTGWHTYGADWQRGEVSFYYDGRPAGVITTGVTNMPMYLILENSLSGVFGGRPVLPATMKVRYVRVWSGPTSMTSP